MLPELMLVRQAVLLLSDGFSISSSHIAHVTRDREGTGPCKDLRDNCRVKVELVSTDRGRVPAASVSRNVIERTKGSSSGCESRKG